MGFLYAGTIDATAFSLRISAVNNPQGLQMGELTDRAVSRSVVAVPLASLTAASGRCRCLCLWATLDAGSIGASDASSSSCGSPCRSDDGRDVDKSCDSGCFLKHRMALVSGSVPGCGARGPLLLKDPPLGRR